MKNKSMGLQIINSIKGEPEFALVPIEKFKNLPSEILSELFSDYVKDYFKNTVDT